MRLTATQQFTDKQGREHKEGESFEVRDNQEAQGYISAGQAREEKQQQQGQESGQPGRR